MNDKNSSCIISLNFDIFSKNNSKLNISILLLNNCEMNSSIDILFLFLSFFNILSKYFVKIFLISACSSDKPK